ncbi:fumarylacetoacetase [Ancylobacter terrae]|uniref:fumarylacetoacetase n=1 Tax=Ancylobacter sp. sgz301288 TaxID=3342077 RepID=UPI00385DF3D7
MRLLRSWVGSANAPSSPFPLNNLPCGVFSLAGAAPRCGIAIGDLILDVAGLEASGLLRLDPAPLFRQPAWNALMAAGPPVWRQLRTRLTELLAEGAPERAAVEPFLAAQSDAHLHLPFTVAEFTDFYAGRHHAENVGAMFRGSNTLPPNWLHMPIGYNGRASSVVVSGTPVRRPWGQVKGPDDAAPVFRPSGRFDFELEIGAVVGVPSVPGRPVSVAEAEAMIFGYVLLNDWSARDIQAFEYQPLGPFQSKATATSIGPWIVMAAALEPFRIPGPEREVALLDHLREPWPMRHDIALEIALAPADGAETVIARTRSRELTYSAAQQLAHHAACGCPMNTGDLLGSGTISGPTRESRGSLLEISWNGTEPLTLPGGEVRRFIEDGDTLTLRGQVAADGYLIGFGACAGTVLPALADPYSR